MWADAGQSKQDSSAEENRFEQVADGAQAGGRNSTTN